MTERLTKRSTDTTHENGVCCTHFNGKECQEFAGNCAYGCKWEEAVWSKLAHYEDLEEKCKEETTYDFKTLLWKWKEFYEDIAQWIKWRDINEQGRLVVLSEGFDGEKFIKYMASKHCPSNFGFKDKDRLQGRCAGGKECEECWEKALKGGAE